MKVLHGGNVRALKHVVEAPICAVCKRPVDRFEWEYSINDDTRTYKAYCHGATQQARLSSMQMVSGRIELGMAFDFPKLTND